MSINSKMRQFDINLINYINAEIENGMPISAVVLSLDKCLCSARLAEERAIAAEKEEAEMLSTMAEQENDNSDDGKLDALISEININEDCRPDELEDEDLDPAWKM